MKIIILSDNPKLRGRAYFIAESLIDKGHEVHYLMWDFPFHMNRKELLRHFFTSLKTQQYQHGKVTVHKIGRLPYFWPYINGVLFRHQLKRLYKKVSADLIYTATYTNEMEAPESLPFIYDLADDYAAPADLYGSPIYKLAFKLLDVRGTMKRQCKNALAVTAISDNLVNFAKQHNDTILKLPSAVEKKVITEILNDPSIQPSTDYSIIYVGMFGRWSQPVETMQAVVDLRNEFPAIDLTMIGPGVETENIKNFIKDNDAGDFIHFLGPIFDSYKKFTYIKRSSVGLCMSKKDRFRDSAHPVKVLEYSAMGKKVVSANLTEVEALGFRNIFVFNDSKKGPDLKTAIRQALLEKTDEKEHAKISIHVLNEYNWDKLTDDLLELIKKVNQR